MVIKPQQDEHKKVIEPIGFISEIVVHSNRMLNVLLYQ